MTTSQTWRLSSFRNSATGSRIGLLLVLLQLLQQRQAIHPRHIDIGHNQIDLAILSTIIVSAYGDVSNIRTAMNRGAFDFVTKPIDFQDLQTTIAKTIRHIELLRDARQRQTVAERAYASLSRYFSPNLAQELASDTDAIRIVMD